MLFWLSALLTPAQQKQTEVSVFSIVRRVPTKGHKLTELTAQLQDNYRMQTATAPTSQDLLSGCLWVLGLSVLTSRIS